MKNKFLYLVSSFLIFVCAAAQKKQPVQLKNAELNAFIGSIKFYESKDLKDYRFTTIIVSNPYGSLKSEETEEVSERLYLSLCSFGELLECKLYMLDELLNTGILELTEDSKHVYVKIKSGKANNLIESYITLDK